MNCEMTNEERAIARIQQASEIAISHKKVLVVAYSGGKDSEVLLSLALKSDVPILVKHSHTTVDSPETVYHIREVFAELEKQGIITKINMPAITMWKLIEKQCFPPTRLMRYCCKYFKEQRFEGEHVLTGVRWAESRTRKKRGLHEKAATNPESRIIYFDENDDKRKLTEICQLRNSIITNPIIDWSDNSIIKYIEDNEIKLNPMYSMGFSRVGCVGCPMAVMKSRLKAFEIYPKFKQNYIKAFERMLEERKRKGKPTNWKNPQDVFDWWISDCKKDVNQLNFDEVEI